MLLQLAVPLAAQNRPIQFDRLTSQEGLSQSDVYATAQDRLGFMWFGTQDGLNRYDGQGFEQFTHDPDDPSSLGHGFAYALLHDSRGFLWVGTAGGGLGRRDPSAGSFTHFRQIPSDPNSLSSDTIRVLVEDRAGTVWVGTDGGGLNRFEPTSQSFTRYLSNPGTPNSLSSDRIRALYPEENGILWIGTLGGTLDRFDPNEGTFTHVPLAGCSDDRGEPSVRAVLVDRQKVLWAGTYEAGLFRIDPAEGSCRQFKHHLEDPASLSSDRVRAIFEDQEGTLWVGTDNGLNAWDSESEGFLRVRNDPGDAASLSSNSVLSIYQDRAGVLWIGTHGGGVNKWNPITSYFQAHRASSTEPEGLPNKPVWSLAVDVDGSPLVGTYGGGLSRLDRSTGTYTHFRHDPEDPRSLSDDRVMSLLVDSGGAVWAGTFEGGLNRLDRRRGTFTRFRHQPELPAEKSLSDDGVVTLLEGADGFLWIGTHGGGLNRLDRQRSEFVHYRRGSESSVGLSSDRITALCEDGDRVLWIGTEDRGLNRLDRAAGNFTQFVHEPGNPRSLMSDTIFSLHRSRDGSLWVGTQSGLHRWAPEARAAHRGIFTRYSTRQGLPNNSIWGILEDEAGLIWVSTNRGLSRLDPVTETFENFDRSHGLGENEFNHGAYHRQASGEMFFGGSHGFVSFHPSAVRQNTFAPPVALTDLLILNESVDLGRPLSEIDAIRLTHRDYVVSFEFAALEFTAPHKNRYAYRLEGFDNDWVESGTISRATYTNLEPGSYLFRVKAANHDGVWNEEGLSLAVTVKPSPWRTGWAYLLYTLMALLALFGYRRMQRRRRAAEAGYSSKLEREVQARTSELADKNRVLSEVNQKLSEASVTDSLTGLKNRRYLLTSVQQDIALVDRYFAPEAGESIGDRSRRAGLLFLIFDLDGFKQINDKHGHAIGDLVLVQVRDLLTPICRESDTLIRWGGDEFLLVGRHADARSAEALAHRIRDAVRGNPFDVGTSRPVRLTCSIGFAIYPFAPGESRLHWEQVIGIADRALYIAKQSGRDEWVGLLGTEGTAGVPSDRLLEEVHDRPEALVEKGQLELRTSISDRRAMRWARA